jgi:hypothetical protein
MEKENKEILYNSIDINYDSLYEDYCTDCFNLKEEPKDRYSEDFLEWVDIQQQDIYENLMDNIKASIYDDKSFIINMKITSQNKTFSSVIIIHSLYNAILYCIENSNNFKIEHSCNMLHITVKYENITNYYTLIDLGIGIKLNELNL